MTEMGTVPMGVRHLSNLPRPDSNILSGNVKKSSSDNLTVKLFKYNYNYSAAPTESSG